MSLIKLSLLIILEKLFKLFALRHSIGKKNPTKLDLYKCGIWKLRFFVSFVSWTKNILKEKLFESEYKQNYSFRLKRGKRPFGWVIGRFDNSRVQKIGNYCRFKSPDTSSVCGKVTVFTRISAAVLIKTDSAQSLSNQRKNYWILTAH